MAGSSRESAGYGRQLYPVPPRSLGEPSKAFSPMADLAAPAILSTRTMAAHEPEHSLEVELPFLQKAHASFSVVPSVVERLDFKRFGPRTPVVSAR
jgi:Memo-like protein